MFKIISSYKIIILIGFIKNNSHNDIIDNDYNDNDKAKNNNSKNNNDNDNNNNKSPRD